MKAAFTILVALPTVVLAAPAADKVVAFPGLVEPMPSSVYSGYIDAEAGGQKYRSFYVFTEASGPTPPMKAPLLLWQQGGPGSSGLGFGYLAELGPYRLTADSLTQNTTSIPRPFLNPHSFDRLANLLIFEHPPGTGFSYCYDASNKPVDCIWNDQTQAVAFSNTIAAWYEKFDEYSSHDLYLMGESYAGLLLPFLTNRLVTDDKATTAGKQLKALAVGNGCPGLSGSTPSARGTCNGPYGSYDTQHIIELGFGHSAVSRALYDATMTSCKLPCKAPTWSENCRTFSDECRKNIDAVMSAMGSFNIYNFYDNCGSGNQIEAHRRLDALDFDALNQSPLPSTDNPKPHTGGEVYPCGTEAAAAAWANNAAVRTALHVLPASFYNRTWPHNGMQYTTYTGASYDIYPNILKSVRTTIYNGDVDACVPYNSNEDWIAALAAEQKYPMKEAWRPWLLDNVPAGYVTTYGPMQSGHNWTFVTIKDAGHMVPEYQPERALAMTTRFLAGGTY